MAKSVSITVDTNGNVTATPNILDVGTSNGTVVINFNMDTDGWEITDVTGLPDAEFTGKGKNGKGYKVTDKNDNSSDYNYTVTVQHTASGRTLMHDPIIRNGGQGN
jgi:hypothetical protein